MSFAENVGELFAKRREVLVGAIIALVLLSLGVLKTLLQVAQPPEIAAAPAAETVVVTPEEVSTRMKLAEKLDAARREKARAAIAEHKVLIETNWRAEDTPDRVMAMGNLYQYQLDDYQSAIQQYRSLVSNFPNHSQTPQAYVELATCFERLGDDTQAKYVYREMVDSLDPSLQHTKFARLKLEGKQ
ncbi:MAG: hypothetical protein C4532_15970 [Candidatus Abyssobacteria bacterium SURF_17]|uniref:Outer membrane protein assembly factor BamD n=1 Tax=Candidatus Abyssobacteria bacterium SURF_17 TaxID=2093361 RepID=A0A419ESJ2_9BACT|nr:MAG: hypothetical protein C4532_15970 [Candidatus Abyssubacteria bacterium SURF_17]